MNIKFVLHNLKREIETHGKSYEFRRNKLNEDLEPTGETETIAVSCGLFHTTKIYSTEKTKDGTKTHSKAQPMMLILFEDGKNIKSGDFVVINNQKFKVIAKNNIQEYSIVYDISLEVVLSGNI